MHQNFNPAAPPPFSPSANAGIQALCPRRTRSSGRPHCIGLSISPNTPDWIGMNPVSLAAICGKISYE
ncbi:hypothetical protein DPEC_G00009340 [Dallia pectoralis]|uniref:Uncharacterized protein n=1 Tax=Dallia pectoralis TaxID=75939 RepID=A0ACC2HLT8_DALPE|nr:hypothetical protein DPEC_G00009340 [Dallia pectoralis]